MVREDVDLTARDLLRILFKYKYHMVLIFIIGIVGSLVYCIAKAPIYRAETDILVQMGREKFSAVNAARNDNYNVMFQERTQNINNELAIMGGEELLSRAIIHIKHKLENLPVIKKKGVLAKTKAWVKDLIKDLKQMVKEPLYKLSLSQKLTEDQVFAIVISEAFNARFLEDTDIIKLSFDWTHPQFAADVVNYYAREYLIRHAEVHQTGQSYELYLEQVEIQKEKLMAIETELNRFYQEEHIPQAEKQKELLLTSIESLEKERNSIVGELEETHIKIDNIKKMMRNEDEWIETLNIGRLGARITDLSKLDQIFFDLKSKRDELLVRFMETSKEINDIDQQMASMKKQKAQSLFNILNTEKSALMNRKNKLTRLIEQKRRNLDRITLSKIHLEQIERRRAVAKDAYLLANKKAEDFKIFNELDKNQILSVKVINWALPPALPYAPRKMMILGITAFVSLFFGFGYAVLCEFFNQGINDRKDVEDMLGIPFLAAVPDMKKMRVNR